MTRRLRSEKCPRCHLPPVLCLCEALTPIAVPVRIIVVMHSKEAARPSNSGHLLPFLLEGASVVHRGEAEGSGDLPPYEAPAAVLFPADAARALQPDDPLRTLFVPDGNWRQARRIAQREPALASARRVCLPAGGPPLARLRGHPEADHLATLEAVARALGALGHTAAQAHLEAIWLRFAAAIERLRLGGI